MNREKELFEEINAQYSSEKAGPSVIDIDKIKNKVNENIAYTYKKKEGKIMKLKWTSGIAAALLVSIVFMLNMFPAFAATLSDVPVLKHIVNVVTFGRYQTEEGGYHADIVIPEIDGLVDKELEKKLNDEFKENADKLIAAYENDVKELKEMYGDDLVHMGIESDYEIKANNDKVLSLDIYTFNVAGSSSTTHKYYTIDKNKNELLTLSDLFEDEADYIEVLSEYIRQEMIKANESGEGYFWVEPDEYTEGFKGIDENSKFYINNQNQLVICFDKYEVAAGAGGCPEFVIPTELIQNIYKGI